MKILLPIFLLLSLSLACATLTEESTPAAPTATPSITPTSTPTPRPTADATATAEARATQDMAFLVENVAPDLELAGYSLEDGNLVATYDREIELSINGGYYYDWAELGSSAQSVFSDFVLSYDVAWNTEVGFAGCGVILRLDGADFELADQIWLETWRYSGLPSWALTRYQYNEYKGTISGDIRSSAAINNQNGSTNHWVIVADGPTITVYVNGERLGVGTAPEHLSQGKLALMIWQQSGNSSCEFNNVWLWELPG